MSTEAASTGAETAETAEVQAETTLVTGAEAAAESGAADAETETEQAQAGSEAEAGAEVIETEEGKEAAEGEGEEGDEPAGAPEEYAEFTMPEGIELDTELSDQFKGVAKDLNLTQEQAQRVVDLAADMRKRDVETIVAMRAEWIDQTKTDKEIGGDKLDANLAVAKRAVDAYGSPEFTKLLNESGLGNHPEVVRFMVNAGRAVSEDQVVKGTGHSSTPEGSLATRLYGKNKE